MAEDAPPPVKRETIALPWYRESAWRAWVKGTFSDFAIATGAILGILGTGQPFTWVPLGFAAGFRFKALLESAYDIWWGGPQTFQAPPPEGANG